MISVLGCLCASRSLCWNHCLNCCFCISTALWVCFHEYLMSFVLIWGAARRPFKVCFCTNCQGTVCEQFQHWFLCKHFLVTHLHSHCRRTNKMGASDWELDCCRWWNTKMTGFLLVSLSENRHVPLSSYSWLYHLSTPLHFIFYSLFHSLPDNWQLTASPPPPPAPHPPLLFPLIPYLHPQRGCLSLNRRKHRYCWSAPCPYYQSMTRSCTVNLSD